MKDNEEPTKKTEPPAADFEGPRESVKSEPVEPEPVEDTETSEPEPAEPTEASRWQRFRRWYLSHKKLSLPLTLLIVLVLLAAVPFTRYAIAGTFMSQDVQVQVLDSKTGAAVSDATVKVGSNSGTTNGTGYATLRDVKVGGVAIKVTKKYYKDSELKVTVPIIKSKKAFSVALEATGRQIKVKVTNLISQKALADVEIVISDVKASTDKSGTAIVVLPVGPKTHEAKLSLSGYNDSKVMVQVSDTEIKENSFKLTPSGSVYFLSNRTGNLDVMKSNLDGTDAKVVLAGTGSEDTNNTVLIASPDWKYLALLARRDSTKAKIYVITTSDDKLTTADEGSANFTLSGWLSSSLVYTVSRTDLNPWQTGAGKLKAYDANSGKITMLDQTTGSGDVNSNTYEYYNFVFLSGDTVVYAKGWTTQSLDSADFNGKQETLSSISTAGKDHKVVASYDAATKSVDFSPYLPNSIYLLTSTQGGDDYSYFDYRVGSTPQQTSLSLDEFYKSYPTYYASADGKKAVWTEQRDGKNAILVGDSDGSSGKSVAGLSEHFAVGWYSPQYILLDKDGSELAIIGASGGEPLKITDYQGSSYYGTPPLSSY